MRQLPHALKEYINECYHVLPIDKNNLKLTEEKNSTHVYIKLKDRDCDNIFCFSIDKEKTKNSKCATGNNIFPFFNASVEGLCVKNDFTLVHQIGNKISVLFIELKSNNQKGHLEQLKTGKLFFQFVIEKIKLCTSDFQDIDSCLEYKFILFRFPRKTASKFNSTQTRNQKKSEQGELPIDYLVINKTYPLSQFIK